MTMPKPQTTPKQGKTPVSRTEAKATLTAVDGVAMVASVLAAGLAFFTTVLGDPTDGRTWWGQAARTLCLVGFAATLLTVAFSIMVVAGTGVGGLGDTVSREAVLRGATYEAALARLAGLCMVAASFTSLVRLPCVVPVCCGRLNQCVGCFQC